MYFFYYIPVGISAELRKFPSMTLFLSLICAFIFFVNKYLSAFVPLDFMNLVYVPEYSGALTAVTAAFLHMGYLHLIGNLLYLIFLGRYVEDRMGPVMYVLLFVTSAWVGNYCQGWYNIHILGREYVGIIGASGAVSAILGFFAVRFLLARLKIAYWVFMPLQAYTRAGIVEVPAILAVVLWFLIQSAKGLVQYGGGWENVAYVTHITGFMWGIAFSLLLGEYGKGKLEALWIRSQKRFADCDYYAAQADLLKYLDQCPGDGRALASLARVQLVIGDNTGARDNYRRGCELLLESMQRGQAEELYREAVRGFEDLTLGEDAQLDLAFGLERNLKPELALIAYANFERRYPHHPEAPFTLLRKANLHWNTFSDSEEAAGCYRRLVTLYPGDSWADFAREQIRVLEAPQAAS